MSPLPPPWPPALSNCTVIFLNFVPCFCYGILWTFFPWYIPQIMQLSCLSKLFLSLSSYSLTPNIFQYFHRISSRPDKSALKLPQEHCFEDESFAVNPEKWFLPNVQNTILQLEHLEPFSINVFTQCFVPIQMRHALQILFLPIRCEFSFVSVSKLA